MKPFLVLGFLARTGAYLAKLLWEGYRVCHTSRNAQIASCRNSERLKIGQALSLEPTPVWNPAQKRRNRANNIKEFVFAILAATILCGTSFGYTPGPGTPTLVQHVATGMDNTWLGTPDGNNTFTVNLPNQTLSGNLLVLGIQCNGVGSIVSVKDSAGTNLIAGPSINGSSKKAWIYYEPNCAAGLTSVIVTFSGLTGTFTVGAEHAVLDEWTNVIASPFDGQSSNANSHTAGLITTTSAGDLVWNWAIDLTDNASGPGFNGTSVTPGSGFTPISLDIQVGSVEQYQIQSNAGGINPVSTSNPSTATWASLAIAFKSGSAGTAPGNGIRIIGRQSISITGNTETSAPIAVNSLPFPAHGNLLVAALTSALYHLFPKWT